MKKSSSIPGLETLFAQKDEEDVIRSMADAMCKDIGARGTSLELAALIVQEETFATDWLMENGQRVWQRVLCIHQQPHSTPRPIRKNRNHDGIDKGDSIKERPKSSVVDRAMVYDHETTDDELDILEEKAVSTTSHTTAE